MIKILLVDDQELFRESLKIVLENTPDFKITDVVGSVDEMMESMESSLPDVILMDIRMPGKDGVEGTRLVKNKYPQVKVIVLTTFDDDEYVFGALKYGADGYLLKGSSVSVLTDAIRVAFKGGAIINPDVAGKMIRQFFSLATKQADPPVDTSMVSDFNESEIKIIRAVGHGLSNKEISKKLYLSEGTVRNYISTILFKLDFRDRTQLAIWAIQTGIAGNKDE